MKKGNGEWLKTEEERTEEWQKGYNYDPLHYMPSIFKGNLDDD